MYNPTTAMHVQVSVPLAMVLQSVSIPGSGMPCCSIMTTWLMSLCPLYASKLFKLERLAAEALRYAKITTYTSITYEVAKFTVCVLRDHNHIQTSS